MNLRRNKLDDVHIRTNRLDNLKRTGGIVVVALGCPPAWMPNLVYDTKKELLPQSPEQILSVVNALSGVIAESRRPVKTDSFVESGFVASILSVGQTTLELATKKDVRDLFFISKTEGSHDIATLRAIALVADGYVITSPDVISDADAQEVTDTLQVIARTMLDAMQGGKVDLSDKI